MKRTPFGFQIKITDNLSGIFDHPVARNYRTAAGRYIYWTKGPFPYENLDNVFVFLSGADTYRLFKRKDEYLAVSYFTSVGVFLYGFNYPGHHIG